MKEPLDELVNALEQATGAVREVLEKADRAGLYYSLPRLAAAEIMRREKRGQLFGADLFSDPAWDILLNLYVSEEAGRVANATSVAIGCNASATVVLRYLEALEEAGHVSRDGTDKRLDRIRLTSEARLKMAAYLLDGRALVSLPRDPRSDARASPPQ